MWYSSHRHRWFIGFGQAKDMIESVAPVLNALEVAGMWVV